MTLTSGSDMEVTDSEVSLVGSEKQMERCENECESYPGDVTEGDLRNWSLTSQTCAFINLQAIKDGSDYFSPEWTVFMHKHRKFCILSDSSIMYPNNTGTHLEKSGEHHYEPTPFCPQLEQHRVMLQNFPLCLACPTCWSVKRSGDLNGAKDRPVVKAINPTAKTVTSKFCSRPAKPREVTDVGVKSSARKVAQKLIHSSIYKHSPCKRVLRSHRKLNAIS